MNFPEKFVMNTATVADLAKHTRSSIESLLESLGWPAHEMAFHLAIDRCLKLEEKKTDDSH